MNNVAIKFGMLINKYHDHLSGKMKLCLHFDRTL